MPVRYMVSMTWSRESLWPSVSCMAMRQALTALTAPMALRSMQGNLDEAADGVAGHAEVVFHGDLGGVLDLVVGAVECGDEAAGGHGAGDTDLTLAADFGAGDGGVLLIEDADGGGGEEVAKEAGLFFGGG